jgi:biotin carboxyl carrier protein
MSSSSFKARVNDEKEFSFPVDPTTDLNAIPIDTSRHHVLCDGKSYVATVSHHDFNSRSYGVRIGSNAYRIQIETPLDDLIQSMGYRLSSEQALGTIQAPMPGIILDVRVSQGDTVKKGDALLILEAMKMENVIISPKDGVVKTIDVATGQTVDKNKLLVELE